MICSMTAFSRKTINMPWGSAVCELRAVNHRYNELSVRLPEHLLLLEAFFRAYLKQKIARGKVECCFRVKYNQDVDQSFTIDTGALKKLHEVTQEISKVIANTAPLNPLEVINYPGILQQNELDNFEVVKSDLYGLLVDTVADFLRVRCAEGERLTKIILERKEKIDTEIDLIRKRIPDILQSEKLRLEEKFQEAKITLEPERLAQEMLLFAQKTDVVEELDRLAVHAFEMEKIFAKGGIVGRRLDFLLQEMNREANTLGAKSNNIDLTRSSVELKVLIEQIREQVQNIE